MERELPSELPAGFKKLTEEVLGFAEQTDEADRIPHEGKLGIYMVHTYDARGNFVPQEFLDRMMVSLIFSLIPRPPPLPLFFFFFFRYAADRLCQPGPSAL